MMEGQQIANVLMLAIVFSFLAFTYWCDLR